MKFRLTSTIFILALSLISIIPTFSHAQIPTSIDGVQIDTYPTFPAPNDSVKVSVESYSTDLNSASIIWLVDGKEFAKGVGRKSIDLTSPALGKTRNIISVIMTVEGREVRKVLSLKSGGVDLIWESGGHTPPLYKGKAQFAYENEIRVIAIPHLAGINGTEINPETLVYKWTLNDKVVQDQSGYGKQTLTIQTEIPRPINIEVEVSTKNGSDKATKTLSLTPTDPSVSFYQEDPLYGVLYNKAITNRISFTDQELNIVAVPYTFNVSKASPVTFLWSINNIERKDLSTNESIVLRTKGDTAGSSNISLEIKSVDSILQRAQNAISVQFSKKQNASTNTF